MRAGTLIAQGLAIAVLTASAPGDAEPRLRPAAQRVKSLTRQPALGGLEPAERQRLWAGEVVSRPLVIDARGGHYVGGVSYQRVESSPEEVIAALTTVEQLTRVLPRTKRARLVDVREGAARVELTQGNSLVQATYTVQLRRTSQHELRFWLDARRPHDIQDVWGYFRAVPAPGGGTLLTVAVLLDLGPGIARMLFEERVQRVILDTPRHIRDFLEPDALAQR